MNYDATKYRVWDWKNPFVFHWIINPGIAINELIFGQRVPKQMLIERNPKKSLADKSYIPCPHCGTIHPALKWNSKNNTGFGNWFGLYCDNCGKIIPCVINFVSFILLALTFPVWYWFKDRWKQKWLQAQTKKFSKPLELTKTDIIWWHVGLEYGLALLVFMSFFNFVALKESFVWQKFLTNAVVYLISGLFFGLFMEKILGGRNKKQSDTIIT